MQVKSKQRVADFGEVYTNEREVNAMLDLVKSQATDPDKTFLEPACGTGNFLIEILRRKLTALESQYKKLQYDYERNAILAVSSLYGIELLPDNVAECQARLLALFTERYQQLFPKTHKPELLRSAEFILRKNILCGDALSLKTAEGNDIIFTEWQFVNTSQIKRRDFVYEDLVQLNGLPLFSDEGEQALIPTPIKDYPPIHFLELGND